MRRLLLCCLLGLLSACAQFGAPPLKPQVALSGVMLEELGVFEQQFLLVLRVSNPNDTDLTLNGVEFNLELNGEPFARGETREPVTLPRKGDALVKLRIKTSLAGILKQIRVLQSGEKPLGYRIIGKLYVPWLPGGIAFDRKGELPALNQIFPEIPAKVEKL